MRNELWTEGLVLGIILLFFCTSVIPAIRLDSKIKNIGEQSVNSKIDWWSMFHHDASHSGYSTSTAPNTNNVLWTYTAFLSYVYSSPAVADGKVYVGSNDWYINCFDAQTGGLLWRYYTNGGVLSSPAIADGKVYVGSWDSYLYCLDAMTGGLLWKYPTLAGVSLSSPAVADGKVCVESTDQHVYCLDAQTGELLWSYDTHAPAYSSPAVADGKVYVGSLGGFLYCFDATTGEILWSYFINMADSSPAIADGKVYVGSLYGVLYCFNATNGELLWNYTTSSEFYSSPAIAYGKVYVGNNDDNLYCFDAETGAFLWSYTTLNDVFSSPAIADGKVYVGSMDDNVYCLDAMTGTFLWSYTTGDSVESSPAVADGKVYIGSNDKCFYCFGKQSNQPPNTPIITGPTEGKIKVATAYNFTTTDPNGDMVYYFIDWGDNTNSSWIGPYSSGDEIIKSHTWSKKGDYPIKAIAKDVYGYLSEWATLSVTMPCSYNIPMQWFWASLFERFPHVFPILRGLLGY